MLIWFGEMQLKNIYLQIQDKDLEGELFNENLFLTKLQLGTTKPII